MINISLKRVTLPVKAWDGYTVFTYDILLNGSYAGQCFSITFITSQLPTEGDIEEMALQKATELITKELTHGLMHLCRRSNYITN